MPSQRNQQKHDFVVYLYNKIGFPLHIFGVEKVEGNT